MGNRLRSKIKIMITASEHPHDTYAPLRSNAAETATYIAANTIFRKLFGIDQYRSQSTESLSLVYDRYGSVAVVHHYIRRMSAFGCIPATIGNQSPCQFICLIGCHAFVASPEMTVFKVANHSLPIFVINPVVWIFSKLIGR